MSVPLFFFSLDVGAAIFVSPGDPAWAYFTLLPSGISPVLDAVLARLDFHVLSDSNVLSAIYFRACLSAIDPTGFLCSAFFAFVLPRRPWRNPLITL